MKILTIVVAAAALTATTAPAFADPVPYSDMGKPRVEHRIEIQKEHHQMIMRHHMRHRMMHHHAMMMRRHHRMMHHDMDHHDTEHHDEAH